MFRVWFMSQLHDIFFPFGVTIDFFFAGPGGFRAGNLDFGVFHAALIYVPDFFIDSAESTTRDAMFNGTSTTAKHGAYTKGINCCPSFQQGGNFPFVEITTGEYAHIAQTYTIKLFANIEAICYQVPTIQAHSGKSMPQCFLYTLRDHNGSMDGNAGIIGIEQQGIAVVSIRYRLKSLFLCGEKFN